MKTIYIPKGETVSYENLVTDRIVVKGCLKVLDGIKAKSITGSGVIYAGSVSADDIRVDDLEAAAVTCRRLIAKRVLLPGRLLRGDREADGGRQRNLRGEGGGDHSPAAQKAHSVRLAAGVSAAFFVDMADRTHSSESACGRRAEACGGRVGEGAGGACGEIFGKERSRAGPHDRHVQLSAGIRLYPEGPPRYTGGERPHL